MSHVDLSVHMHSCTGAAIFNSRCGGARTRRVRAPRAWCGLYTLVNRNNDVTSLYTCLSRKTTVTAVDTRRQIADLMEDAADSDHAEESEAWQCETDVCETE